MVVPADVTDAEVLNWLLPIMKGLLPVKALDAVRTVIDPVWLDNTTLLLFTARLPDIVTLPVN